jgi:hypothetical protein
MQLSVVAFMTDLIINKAISIAVSFVPMTMPLPVFAVGIPD